MNITASHVDSGDTIIIAGRPLTVSFTQAIVKSNLDCVRIFTNEVDMPFMVLSNAIVEVA